MSEPVQDSIEGKNASSANGMQRSNPMLTRQLIHVRDNTTMARPTGANQTGGMNLDFTPELYASKL